MPITISNNNGDNIVATALTHCQLINCVKSAVTVKLIMVEDANDDKANEIDLRTITKIVHLAHKINPSLTIVKAQAVAEPKTTTKSLANVIAENIVQQTSEARITEDGARCNYVQLVDNQLILAKKLGVKVLTN